MLHGYPYSVFNAGFSLMRLWSLYHPGKMICIHLYSDFLRQQILSVYSLLSAILSPRLEVQMNHLKWQSLYLQRLFNSQLTNLHCAWKCTLFKLGYFDCKILTLLFSHSQVFLFYRLFNLYNLLENPYSRFHVYMKALDLALKGKAPEHIIPSLKKIESFLREWNVGIIEQRELFLAIASVLKESKRYYRMNDVSKWVILILSLLFTISYLLCFYFDMSDLFTLTNNIKLIYDWQLLFDFSSANDYFKFLTKYLATFSGEDAYILSEAKEEAARAIVEFVKAPNMFRVFYCLLYCNLFLSYLP